MSDFSSVMLGPRITAVNGVVRITALNAATSEDHSSSKQCAPICRRCGRRR